MRQYWYIEDSDPTIEWFQRTLSNLCTRSGVKGTGELPGFFAAGTPGNEELTFGGGPVNPALAIAFGHEQLPSLGKYCIGWPVERLVRLTRPAGRTQEVKQLSFR